MIVTVVVVGVELRWLSPRVLLASTPIVLVCTLYREDLRLS
jgi:hypothetical protein